MAQKKIIIIGAGITGCAIASKLQAENFDVTVYDKSDTIGGIIKDIKHKNDFYFNGCHILDSSEWLLNFLNERSSEDLIKSRLIHSSYNNIFGKEIIDDEIAHPTFEEKIEIPKKNTDRINNLYDRLKCYPEIISKGLIDWVSKFIDPKIISKDMSKIFHINRIFFKENTDLVKKLKKESDFYNDILGLKVKSDDEFYIPKYGFTKFLKNFENYLRNKGVKFCLNSVVKVDFKNKKTILISKGKEISYDYVFWAANPIILTSKLKIEYENISVNYAIITANVLSDNLEIQNRYYQIYDKNSKIVRFFLYNIDKKKISIEILNEKISSENINHYQGKIENLLKKTLNLDIKINELAFQNFRRFGYYSSSNIKQLKKLYDYFKNENFIVEGIHHSQQEKKISALLKSFYKKLKI